MIRRRSYAEAIGGGEFDISSEYTFDNNRCTQFQEIMSRTYISSSEDSAESDTEFKKDVKNKTKSNDPLVKKPKDALMMDDQLEGRSRSNYEMRSKDAFVRSDSVRYYDLNSKESENNASRQSVDEIYNECLNYVSEDSVNSSRKSVDPKEFSVLQKILTYNHSFTRDDNQTERIKMPVKVEILNENRTSFHFNAHSVPFQNMNTDLTIIENGDEERINKPQTRIFDDIFTTEDDEDHEENSKGKTISEVNSNFPMQYIGKNSAKKKKKDQENAGNRSRKAKRIIFKNGYINVPILSNIKGRSLIYLNDFVTTLIECQWRWLAFWFSACNIAVWLGFALMFYVSAYANGDLEENPTGKLCIEEGRTFTGIFTFSVESQVSIGYGEKYPNEECPETTFILLMEVIVGNALIGGMVCIVFAKIIRPQKHLEGVGFSKNAVVCMRDGKLCFVIRVWDILEKHAIGTQISGWFVRHSVGSGPIVKPLVFDSLPFILWPTTLQHVIDEKSPLYDLSAKDLIDKKFEIVITLIGSARSTGLMTQTRTSYISHELLWGSRFKEVVSFKEDVGSYVVDVKSLNSTETVDIPLCSARLLKHFNNALRGNPASISLPASPFFLSPSDSPRSILASPSWSFKLKTIKNNLNSSLPG